MSKKIATLITNLFEDVEYTEPVQAFKEAGHEVITIDKQSGNEVTSKKGTTVKIDKSIDEVHPADFDALLSLVDSLPIYCVKTIVLGNLQKHLSKTKNPFLPFVMDHKC